MADAPAVVRLDDVDAIPWRGTELTWRPVRAALDTRVAGISAYTAERAGQEIVEDHVETRDGRGHEEVYVVLEGRATFLVDGSEIDAPRGTFVKVPPEARRSAVAAEPGTAVLVLGGPPAFEPAVSEWIERARPLFERDPRRAREVLDDLRRVYGDHPGVAFAEALFATHRGEDEAAERFLSEALDRAGSAREAAESEPALRPVLARLSG